MSFVIFDTEYTSWEGCNLNGWKDWQKKEIVQIAALKIDDKTLEVIEEFNLYIKPEVNPVLSDYFMNLTGITNEKLSECGVNFAKAYADFCNFVKDLPCYSHGWSLSSSELADGEVMLENLKLLGVDCEVIPNFKNVAPWFKEQYKKFDIDIKKQCSGEIAGFLHCDNELKNLGLDVHNALYDVYSILAGIKKLTRDYGAKF